MVRQTAACFYRPRCPQKAFREDAFVLILNGFWLSPSHQSGAKISFSFLPTAVTVSSTFFPCHVVYVRLNPWGLEWVQGPLGYLIVPFGCLARQLLVVKDFLLLLAIAVRDGRPWAIPGRLAGLFLPVCFALGSPWDDFFPGGSSVFCLGCWSILSCFHLLLVCTNWSAGCFSFPLVCEVIPF